jgi:mRNA interferase YafQ
MRAIERTTRFKRDYKREMKGRHRATLETDLIAVLRALVNDTPLAEKYHDHPLSGDWSGFRDCHVKPDLLLIYEKPDAETLRLVRLGSHSELGF